jgi:5-formaminoimidazole-4-carboxamide-1-(beta)-D-ribofuranosyl 5'-monophosphate synthetase
MDIKQILKNYDKENITIAVLGSHSALDVCRGAKDLGFKTLVITQKGRGAPYSKYYKTHPVIASEARQFQSSQSTSLADGNHEGSEIAAGSANPRNDEGIIGCVDEALELENFKDILSEENQQKLRDRNAIFIPHRSFEVYINDYDAIENEFEVPMFGNRKLLRSEERGSGNGIDQYKIMDEAGIRYPKQFKNPEEIDRLVIVKVLEKERGFERAFFLADSPSKYEQEKRRLIAEGKVSEEAFEKKVIEEFVSGVQVNFNFFYDSISERLELLGTDTRRQTNLDGIIRIPASQQIDITGSEVFEKVFVKYEEAGHIAVTVLESLLEPAFEIGEKFVEACKKLGLPVIGPFGLQTMIIPGPPKKEIIVFDVSPRMPGSPGIAATPYSGYLFGQSISAGKRVAMEIRDALEKDKLEEVIS